MTVFGMLFSSPSEKLKLLAEKLFAEEGKKCRINGPIEKDGVEFFQFAFDPKNFISLGYIKEGKLYFGRAIGEEAECFKNIGELEQFIRAQLRKGPLPPPSPERNAYVDLAYYLRRQLRPGYRIDGPLHDAKHDYFQLVWAPDPNSVQVLATFGNMKENRLYFLKFADGNMQTFEHKDLVQTLLFGELHVRGVSG